MTIDLRGFVYGLEPIRRRRQWQLDAAQARLGKLEGVIQAAREGLDTLRSRQRLQEAEAGRALTGRLDPDLYRFRLVSLMELRIEIETAAGRLEELIEERAALRRECLVQQRDLDLIESHRVACVAEFTSDVARRDAAAADRDWLARRAAQRLPILPNPKEIPASEVES